MYKLSYILMSLLAVASCATPEHDAVSTVAAPSPMRVHVIDVGQGLAVLFEFADGAVLVDTGGEDNRAFHSTVKLAAYLAEFFANRPDLHGELALLVLSHPHLDHTRGAPMVLANYRPRNVVTNGQISGDGAPNQVALRHWAAMHPGTGFRAVQLEDIPAHGLTDSVIDPVEGVGTDPVITVLWGQVATDPGWGEALKKPRFTNSNNHCVVLRIEIGEASVLVTGDLEDAAIPNLIERYRGTKLLDVDVYVVGQHGAKSGTTSELVAAMSPAIAVIGVGTPDREAENSAWELGHPARETLELLEAGVSQARVPILIRAGSGAKQFHELMLTRAIYATGWDGDVVLEAKASGHFEITSKGLKSRNR